MNPRFTEEFKINAIKKITGREYSVRNVSQCLGVSTRSLYAWMKRNSTVKADTIKDDRSTEIRRLKQELTRIAEGREILKKTTIHSIEQRIPVGPKTK